MSPPSARSGSGFPERPPRLILASASPRRREILERLGIAFEAVVPDVDELQRGRARGGGARERPPQGACGSAGSRAERAIPVLGVDTDVALDGRLLGKAADEAGARERLEALSGRTHEVLSGVAVIGRQPGSVERRRPHRGHLRRARSRDDRPLSRLWGVARPRRRLRDPGPRLDPDQLHPRRLLERRRAAGADPVRAGAVAALSAGARRTATNTVAPTTTGGTYA